MPTRPGQQQAANASATYGSESTTANNNAQADLTQANTDQTNLRSGKMVGADPYLNPTYLAAVNQLRSGALNQENNSADQQLRANQARTGGMNSTATTGAIAKLAGDKMRLGNQVGAEQTAGDWAKNVGYQLNLAQQPLESARVQGQLYNTATTGQSDANKTLSQFGLASYGPWMSAISALGGAAGAALKGGMPGMNMGQYGGDEES
jgi:hypothetical protein